MHSLSFTLALLPSANSSLPPTVTVYPRIPSTRVPSAVTPSLSALAPLTYKLRRLRRALSRRPFKLRGAHRREEDREAFGVAGLAQDLGFK
eukprot:1195315-Prorocentrum_minimum.AAC.4